MIFLPLMLIVTKQFDFHKENLTERYMGEFSTPEDPSAGDEQPDLFPVHLPPRTPSLTPIQYATPNDNEKTKHLDYRL
ncbi:hypothetical protein LXL04_013753 [Taraxacum kok-saghyz]